MTSSDNELDWSYTVRCTKEWSGDELLSHLCSKAFTIPPRDYTPSAPFVYVRTEDGVTTVLPHGYRIPLMFVARYQWETIFRTLSLQNRQHWEAVRDEILHLSRLCHVLFSEARAKAESSGMEKGWRCVMFDRVLTRFYKGWPVSSPAKLKAFISHFNSKEYERDVLKNDWKRWALKGFFRPPSSSPSIHLTEDDVNNGITAVGFNTRLSKIDNVWTLSTRTKYNNLKRRPIKFLQPTEGSSSELTDFDLSLDEDEDEDDGNTNLDLHPPMLVESPAKRCRESEDDDAKNRSGKRAKMEEIIRSLSSLPFSPIVSPRPLGSVDVFDDEHDPLPKFKVPRQILHSYGWKPLSSTDGLDRRQSEEQRGKEGEAGTGTDVLPECGFDDLSTSTSPSFELELLLLTRYPFHLPSPEANPSDSSSIRPYNDTPFSSQALLESALQPHEPPTSPNLTSISSNSKGKQPESASTNPTTTATSTTTASKNPRNSAYVSLPSSSRMKPRTSPAASASASIPPPSPRPLSPPMTRGRGGVGKGTDPSGNGVLSPLLSELPFSFPVAGKERGRGRQNVRNLRDCRVKSTLDAGRNPTGANGDINKNRKKEEAKTKQNAKNDEKMKIQHSGPSSSSSSSMITTNVETNDECAEQGATSTTIPVPPGRELIPEPIHSTSYSISSSSSSLSSLSSSVTPSPSGPLVFNAADEYGTQQVKDRIRELKTKFLRFKEDLERIIGRLEVLEGGDDGDLGQGGVDVGSSDHPNFVSQASQTDDKRKQSDLDIEMIGVSESGGAVPGYVDAAVGVDADALVALREISVQTVDVSSATPLHSMDDLSNVTKKNLGKIKPTLSLEGIPPTQFVNTTTSNLSTMVDNLVSIKMLSMMQTLVKSGVGGNSNGKAKPVEPCMTTATTTERDSDLICQASPSSSSLSNSGGSHSMDACDSLMSSLLDELKSIKEEARCREQTEKEDLLAMRQLHSAEVDALRRRLSYLESGNLSVGRWDAVGGSANSGRWKGYRVGDSHRHHRVFEDSGTSSTATDSTSTLPLDDTSSMVYLPLPSPLPIKSQRKHHIFGASKK